MVNFIDFGTNVSNAKKLAIELLRNRLDARLGYPRRPTKPDGSPYIDNANPDFGVTWTCSSPIQHPDDETRIALPISDEMAAALTDIKTAVATKVGRGIASATDAAIHALPEPAELDESWIAADSIDVAPVDVEPSPIDPKISPKDSQAVADG